MLQTLDSHHVLEDNARVTKRVVQPGVTSELVADVPTR